MSSQEQTAHADRQTNRMSVPIHRSSFGYKSALTTAPAEGPEAIVEKAQRPTGAICV